MESFASAETRKAWGSEYRRMLRISTYVSICRLDTYITMSSMFMNLLLSLASCILHLASCIRAVHLVEVMSQARASFE